MVTDTEMQAAIGLIYDAGLDAALWPEALQRISDLLGCRRTTLWLQPAAGGMTPLTSAELEPKVAHDYAQHYHRLDDLRPVTMRAPLGTVLTSSRVIPQAEFVGTEFYNDFARVNDIQDCAQARVFEAAAGCSYFGATRSHRAGNFGSSDIQLLQSLMPHLGRAVRTTLRLLSADLRSAGTEALLGQLREGALLLAADGTVLYANAAAEALLRDADGLMTVRKRLCAANAADDALLRPVLAAAAGANRGGTLAVARPSGRCALVVTVQPAAGRGVQDRDLWGAIAAPAVLMFVVEPDRDRDAAAIATKLRALYGLTAAEAATACLVAAGKGVPAAAAVLGVGPATARTHLMRVYAKTGTHRQAELAALVGQLTGR